MAREHAQSMLSSQAQTGRVAVLFRSSDLARYAVEFTPPEPMRPPWVPWMISEVKRRDGAWAFSRSGGCRLNTVLNGVSASPWKLDLAAGEPAPDTQELHILVEEGACASGEPATGRIDPPWVDYGAESVTITITIRPVGDGAACQGNPFTPLVVPLSQALGGRRLLDGSTDPAAPAGTLVGVSA